MKEKKPSKGVHIGTSSILVIFILLALVTFASLSFLSARADYLLSRKMADRTTAYYEADTQASYYLSDVEDILSKQYQQYNNVSDYEASLVDAFADNDTFIINTTVSPAVICYTTTISDTQNLYVELAVNYPDNQDTALYHIKTWRTLSTVDWQPDNTLHLTRPELEE